MRNIKLTIQYDGTNYGGWQSQKNARTIQDAIQKCLKKITGEKIVVTGSGRTDSGVHAMAQVANFRTRSRLPLKNIRMALNSALPDDIAVTGIAEVGHKFNSQHDAKSKLYRYTIVNNDFTYPLIRSFAARSFYELNLKSMRRAAGYLKGRHDFRSFQATDGGAEKNSVRRISGISIEKKGDLIYIYIEAEGFLYNMARNIVGTLIEVGRGKISAEAVKDILKKRDRRSSGPTMPAKGLCLMRVRY